jgi:hypothetical protein
VPMPHIARPVSAPVPTTAPAPSSSTAVPARFDARQRILPTQFMVREVHGVRVKYGSRVPGPGGRGYVQRIELDGVALLVVLTLFVSIPASRRPGYGRRGGRLWRASIRTLEGRPIWTGSASNEDSVLLVLYLSGLVPHPKAPAVMVDAWRAEWPNERARILGTARVCDCCWNHVAAGRVAACPACHRTACPACRPAGKTACRDCAAPLRRPSGVADGRQPGSTASAAVPWIAGN